MFFSVALLCPYRRDTKTVNVLATACLSPVTKVVFIYFLLQNDTIIKDHSLEKS